MLQFDKTNWQHHCACLFVILLLASCSGGKEDLPQESNTGLYVALDTSSYYVGPHACAECHREIYDQSLATAHFRTSALADTGNILGSFEPAHNTLRTSSGITFQMEQRDSGLFQTVTFRRGDKTMYMNEPFDITVGSGRKGQTFLYWHDSVLYQLPISYHVSEGKWVNSPGYVDGDVNYFRPIFPRCLECHATYVENIPTDKGVANVYRPESAILGVTCEKCHGPGSQHVAYHRSRPGQMRGRYITNTGKLGQDSRLDMCGLCHSGSSANKRPVQSYRPGDVLDSFYVRGAADKNAPLDVHGNQVDLLMQSKCFTESPLMNCATCHNVHEHEREKPRLFSQRCMQCHTVAACGMEDRFGKSIADNCIDCHMPRRESSGLVFEVQGRKRPLIVRTHLIGIYPEESDKFAP